MNTVQVNLGKSQLDKIKKSLMNKTKPSVRLSHSDLQGGNTTLMLGQRNYNKLMNHKAKNKGVTLKFTDNEVKQMKSGGFIQGLIGAVAPSIIDAVKEPAQRLLKGGVDKLVGLLTGDDEAQKRKQFEDQYVAERKKEQDENKAAMDAINKKAMEFVRPTQTRSQGRRAPGRSALLTPDMEAKQMEIKGEGMMLKNQGSNSLVNSIAKYGLAEQTGGLLFVPGMRRRQAGCGVSSKNFDKFNQSPLSQANTYAPATPQKITHQLGLKKGRLLIQPNQRGGLLYNPNASM